MIEQYLFIGDSMMIVCSDECPPIPGRYTCCFFCEHKIVNDKNNITCELDNNCGCSYVVYNNNLSCPEIYNKIIPYILGDNEK